MKMNSKHIGGFPIEMKTKKKNYGMLLSYFHKVNLS